MKYHIKASSISNQDAVISIKQSNIGFGITKNTTETLPNPAELFLSSFASCILKNVERFSIMMKFNYSKATIEVTATRIENLPRMEDIVYTLTIYSDDKKLNVNLLKKNIEKFGTIYNTVKLSCNISGTINITENV
ncbi:OsmC family protein [Tenacibaculum sp. 1B UA]|uniref:OsmC family protein n=1 Tax=unclassified Tenacibaculum TaxID=2635139 RepID=UPI0026E25530|nr:MULTISPECIES: OsmC family protein [unclassified Tenacibaculum]MDO6674591.1 OsmC family protein [Tenacibaculum sp. 1_MG-2023]MDX8553755.1 OsmC family protein [Tenacibaculum sp. 1B UA]